MKYLIFVVLFSSLAAKADMSADDLKSLEPSAAEISASRSCFQEAHAQGCGHPRDDVEHFKTCVSDAASSLSAPCRQMLNQLYGKSK